MAFDDLLAGSNISASGLSAERLRMEVVANNIANAFSTRSVDGGPYRRQEVVFEAIFDNHLGRTGSSIGQTPSGLGGVRAAGIVEDQSDFIRIYNPGHPDADQDGYVSMPNVRLPVEMVNLITASRAYEANLKVLQAFRQAAEQALTLAR
jgi:flagellar basal-body rod protein FlgC